ncbi:PD40 domain-containing protein [Pimelobacter simplex]|uniref:PD40 domain-containing protein n=1 Tax=Nocardioides simplex TaxID=2045 RepID=UPI001375606A|nr:PD40 domain-containing protein [Pimelobacter simplex]
MPLPLRRRAAGLIAALGLTASALALTPGAVPAAHAAPTGGGSIVYIKDYNVWITDGDGSVHRQVTRGGTAAAPWRSPSQSDAGVVVAHRAGAIYRMNQRGEVFNAFYPPALFDAIGTTLSGRDLTETAISPDGSKIAYTYYKYSLSKKRWATGFTASDRATDPTKYDIAFFDKPSWVTNSRVVLSHWYRNKAHLFDLGGRDIPWFNESYYTPNAKELTDLEVSRDGEWTVGVRGDVGDQSVVVIHNDGDVRTSAAPWTPVFGVTNPCNIGLADGNLTSPTIAPDGSVLAWAEPAGVFRSSGMTCDPGTRVDIMVAPGGSSPSWSRAAVGQTPSVRHFVAKKRPKVLGPARARKTLRVYAGAWSPAPASVSYQWLRDGKRIAGATKAAYKVRKKDRRHRIAVSVTVRRTGYYVPATVTSTAVRVR